MSSCQSRGRSVISTGEFPLGSLKSTWGLLVGKPQAASSEQSWVPWLGSGKLLGKRSYSGRQFL